MKTLDTLRIDARLRTAHGVSWMLAQTGDHPSRLLHRPWRENPFPTYRRLRERGPMVFSRSPFHAATTRTTVQRVSRDHAVRRGGFDPMRDFARTETTDRPVSSDGTHHCPGSPSARLEGWIALRTLSRRIPGPRPTAMPTRRDTLTVRGLATFPVTVGR